MGTQAAEKETPRKPAKTEGAKEPCFCGHARGDHPAGACSECDCERYLQRPCSHCGHEADAHAGKCRERHCRCKHYKPDNTPQFLLERGIRAGQWQFITTGQLEALMQPGIEHKIRVWACGMLWTIGHRRRVATIFELDKKTGKMRERPASPHDIVKRLRSLETVPTTVKSTVARSLKELHLDGLARKLGKDADGVYRINAPKLRFGTAIAFYIRPRRPIWGTDLYPKCSDVPPHQQLADNPYLRFFAVCVKSFRAAVGEIPDLGDKFAPQELEAELDAAVERIDLVARSEYQRLQEGGKSAAIYKEVSITVSSSSTEKSVSQSVPVESTAQRRTDRLTKNPEKPETKLQPERAKRILQAIPVSLIQDLQELPTEWLIQQIDRGLNGSPPERLTERIDKRRKKITSLGMLVPLAVDVGQAYQHTEQAMAAAATAGAQHTAKIEANRNGMLEELRSQWATMTAEDRTFYRSIWPELREL